MAKVNLHNIAEMGRVERFSEAIELSRATRHTPNLQRELPYPADKYSNPLRAYRRLGYVAKNASRHNLSAYTVSFVAGSVTTIGMATSQLAAPKPIELGARAQKNGSVELSYWHERRAPFGYTEEMAIDIGTRVVARLLAKKSEIPGANGSELPWMVTLPDDVIKRDVCELSSFEKVHEPARYDIGDGVAEPRQLWIRE